MFLLKTTIKRDILYSFILVDRDRAKIIYSYWCRPTRRPESKIVSLGFYSRASNLPLPLKNLGPT
jgi:hypothetical protein